MNTLMTFLAIASVISIFAAVFSVVRVRKNHKKRLEELVEELNKLNRESVKLVRNQGALELELIGPTLSEEDRKSLLDLLQIGFEAVEKQKKRISLEIEELDPRYFARR